MRYTHCIRIYMAAQKYTQIPSIYEYSRAYECLVS